MPSLEVATFFPMAMAAMITAVPIPEVMSGMYHGALFPAMYASGFFMKPFMTANALPAKTPLTEPIAMLQ